MPIASYLLNEKRSAVNAIETRQDGVRCVIVPNDQMETPHYHVLRVRKGEETPTLSYMLPKLHEEAMALPSEEEFAERKRPEQPALATFAMPDVPPAPTPAEPAAPVVAPAPKAAPATPAAPAQPGLLSRFFGALKALFSGGEETKPVSNQHRKQKRNRNVNRIVASLVRTTAVTVMSAATPVVNVQKAAIIAKKTVVIVAGTAANCRDA